MVGLQTRVLALTASPCPASRAVQPPLAAQVGEETPRWKQQQFVASNLGSWDMAPLPHKKNNVWKFQSHPSF